MAEVSTTTLVRRERGIVLCDGVNSPVEQHILARFLPLFVG